MKTLFRIIFLFVLVVGCDSNSKRKGGSNILLGAQVSQVTVLDNQIVLKGQNFSSVTEFKIVEGPMTHDLVIESKDDNEIIAKSRSNLSLPIGQAIKLIISNAKASSDFTLEVSFCRTFLNGGTFECQLGANDKEVLSYNSQNSTWRPRSVNGLSYRGNWDATTPMPTDVESGDYFVVRTSEGNYQAGDWIIYNGSVFERIENAELLIGVYGRTGTITAKEGDYSLMKLSDVTLASSPSENSILVFNGAIWTPVSINQLFNNTSTFTGNKTFNGSVAVSGGVKVGSVSIACDSTKTGTIRYNSALKIVQTCNGSTWD